MSPSRSRSRSRPRTDNPSSKDDGSTPSGSSTSLLSHPALPLLPYSFLVAFATGITVASQLYLLRFISCKAYYAKTDPSRIVFPDSEFCQVKGVSAVQSSMLAILNVIDAVVGLGVTSLVQRVADKYGRRPGLISLPLLEAVSIGVLVLGYKAPNVTLSYTLLLSSTVLTAITRKDLFLPILVVSDVASVQERTPWFARLQGLFLLGGGVAMVSSSVVARVFPSPSQYAAPFAIAAVVQAIAGLWAYFLIPETRIWELQEELEDAEAVVESERTSLSEGRGRVRKLWLAIVSPLKPLELLWPRERADGGSSWNLFLLSTSAFIVLVAAIFPGSALILSLQDSYRFTAAELGYVLAYLLCSRFVVLVIIFPFVLKWGRRAFHHWQLLHPIHRSGPIEAGDETTPLLETTDVAQPGEVLVVEDPASLSNHFDVILAFISLLLDAAGYLGVFFATKWQHVIGCFGLLALGVGYTPSIRSVFLASVEPAQASESMAALEMILSVASIVSPVVMGPLYSILLKVGRGEVLFLIVSCLCLIGSTILLFVRRT